MSLTSGPGISGAVSATLTNLGQVRALSLEKGSQGVPVKVRATVTYRDPEWGMMFIQDQSNAVCLKHSAPFSDPSWRFQPGQVIEVKGFTKRGPIHCDLIEESYRALDVEPLPPLIELGTEESFSTENDWHWAKASGFIYSFHFGGGKSSLLCAVRRGNAQVPLKLWVVDASETYLQSLQDTVVEIRGVFGFVLDANRHLTGENEMWISNLSSIRRIRIVPTLSISDLLALKGNRLSVGPVKLRGNVVSQRPGEFLFVRDDSGTLRVNFEGSASYGAGCPVEVYGFPSIQRDMVVLNDVTVLAPTSALVAANGTESLPVRPTIANTNLSELTRVVQIRNLSAAEAARGYPVRITGVMTYSDTNNWLQFVQDDTAGIFVDLKSRSFDWFPGSRKIVEITGFSGPGDYAPVIEAEAVRVVGEGQFPAPKSTTLQALMTGSEDSQWVTLKGVVRNQVVNQGITDLTLSTEDASIKLSVPHSDKQPAPQKYVDAKVKVQGVCATIFDDRRQLQGVRLCVPNWDQIVVEEIPPADAFALPLRFINEVLQFHSASSDIRRCRVRGVVLLRQAEGSLFLQDGTGGILIQPQKNTASIRVGETAEFVGFPSLLNKLPVLQEALARPVSGDMPLPATRLLPEMPLKEGSHGKLVWLEGKVIGHSASTSSELLTLQFGQWITDAVLEKEQTRDQLADILPGTVVRLKGVYAARLDDNGRLQSFQVLLRSPLDVQVLARPSWWTARHMLVVIGAMALAIFVAMIWITLQHRQVEKRSLQLAVEIQRRESTERQRQLEQERARIARDLHDDLGAALTQIRFLSALEGRDSHVPESTRGRMSQISEKSREMVASLDEIVWAVNPTNDSLPNLAAYLCHFAEEFFRPTAIRCRLDIDDPLPPVPLTSEVRHHIYLAVREALNNISKHSQATKVWLRIQMRRSKLRITIEDNGRGFSMPEAAASGEGLANMRQRMEKIGGRFEVNTRPGTGTTCRFWLALETAPANGSEHISIA